MEVTKVLWLFIDIFWLVYRRLSALLAAIPLSVPLFHASTLDSECSITRALIGEHASTCPNLSAKGEKVWTNRKYLGSPPL